MTTEFLDIDSKVLGGNVLSIHDFDPAADFAAFERGYIREYNPVYVSCRIPLAAVASAHSLEEAGFRFMECQLRLSVRPRKTFDVSGLPYRFERVTTEEALAPVLDIAASTFTHDRFYTDPAFGAHISGARYREYTTRSFRAADEAVYRLLDVTTGATLAFKTHKYLDGQETRLLLAGVHPDYKGLGLGPVNEYFELNELIAKGIRRAVTHISAANHAMFNLEMGGMGFRVIETFAVMRKIYGG